MRKDRKMIFLYSLTGNRVEIPGSAATVKARYLPALWHMYFSVTREGAGSMNNAFYLPCNAFAVLEISKRLFYLDGCGTGHFRKKGGII